jgi:hypothetical protein
MNYKALVVLPLLILEAALTQSGQVSAAQSPSPPAPAMKSPIVPPKPNANDPAYRAGYDNGYRLGANDSEANSNTYNDESGPIYALATKGYSPQYGDTEKYQELFRLGYIAGYKAGWDFNAGEYCGTCGPGGP